MNTSIYRNIFILFAILPVSANLFSQITYPVNDHDGQVIEACSGYFVDSGGDTINEYGSNENYSVTFCSSIDNKHIGMDFSIFDLGPGDYLYVYDGIDDNADLLLEARGNELAGKEIWSSDSCLHFRFGSSPSEHGLGWRASISCYDICELLTAEVTINGRDGLKLCPGTGEATLEANAFYLAENIDFDPSKIEYEWMFDNDDLSSGATLTYDFDDPGAYPFRIKITDTVNNCEVYINKTVQVGTRPNFSGTHPSVDTTCAGDPVILRGVANPIIWTGFPTEVKEDVPVSIRDETNETYESSLNFKVFNEDDTLASENDFGRLCITIDHVDQSHLSFELQCPNGSEVLLKNYGGEEVNLGEPVVFDNTTPGVGYDYCFTNTPEYGLMIETTPEYHEYTDQAGNFYFNAAHLPPGTYTPHESFEEFIGCPLNGEWTLTVTDNTPGDNGFMTSWSLFFDDKYYPDSLIFTPELVSETWYENGRSIEDNPAFITKDDEGKHEFFFEIEDNFGCKYDTSVTFFIEPLPEAEILAEHEFLELSFCEGDSTILSVEPVNDFGDDWIYTWSFNNIEMPDRTFDTIVAKEPGNYSVRITDTITGCVDFFDYELSEENCELEIPNVFTPNNNGFNDYFEILGLEDFEKAQMVIYNRWGDKVFEHSDYRENWWDGSGAPDGVYYYVLSYYRKTYTGKTITKRKHGVVHIVR